METKGVFIRLCANPYASTTLRPHARWPGPSPSLVTNFGAKLQLFHLFFPVLCYFLRGESRYPSTSHTRVKHNAQLQHKTVDHKLANFFSYFASYRIISCIQHLQFIKKSHAFTSSYIRTLCAKLGSGISCRTQTTHRRRNVTDRSMKLSNVL